MISWRNLRGVYGALRRHEGLVLLVDWGYRADGIPVKMFGAWTTLPAGPALLAAKHGSAIVPFSINRQPDGTFRAAADEPIHVASDSPADLAIATQKIATALEGHIAPAPEQWYIFKPIWPAIGRGGGAARGPEPCGDGERRQGRGPERLGRLRAAAGGADRAAGRRSRAAGQATPRADRRSARRPGLRRRSDWRRGRSRHRRR